MGNLFLSQCTSLSTEWRGKRKELANLKLEQQKLANLDNKEKKIQQQQKNKQSFQVLWDYNNLAMGVPKEEKKAAEMKDSERSNG